MCRRTLSTGTAQEPAPEPRSVDLTALIDEVLAEMPRAAVAGANRVPAGFTVTVDDRQLYRALLNLARNAAAAEGTTRVAVEAARRHGAVTIDVVDDGPGLPLGPDGSAGIPDVVAHAGGSGLGLTIADELVRNNAGTLAVASTGTDGTRFRITLPDA
jgi:signal transduction histidine kinase